MRQTGPAGVTLLCKLNKRFGALQSFLAAGRRSYAKTEGEHGGVACADLGGGNFVARLLAEAARREKETLRLSRKVVDLVTLERQIRRVSGVAAGDVRSGDDRRAVVRARRLFCQLAVKGLGYAGAEAARFPGLTTSAVNRLAVSKEVSESRQYSNALWNLL